MTTISALEMEKANDRILPLNDHLSRQRVDNHHINFLNLDRCLRQPYLINDLDNNEAIGGISLADNYLIQMPTFVSDYTNLTELNGSHNELNDAEFLLYGSWNDSERTESYWNQKLKTYSSDQSLRKIVRPDEINCRANKLMTKLEKIKVILTENFNDTNNQ